MVSSSAIEHILSQLQWNEDGLVPVIAQQHTTKDVLMLAWMNADAVRKTLETGQVCYYSRSRKSLWVKGETSGHTQKLVAFRYDCDQDAVLVLVDQTGAACHTFRPNCFYNEVTKEGTEVISEPVIDG